MHRTRIFFAFGLALTLSLGTLGCGGGTDGGGASDASAQAVSGDGPIATEGTAGAPLDDLAPGTYDLTVSGGIASDGAWTNENRPGIFYDPAPRAGNKGPYQLLMRFDLTEYNIERSNVSPDEGEIKFEFPAGLSPGTYDVVGDTGDASEDDVKVEIRAGTGALSQAFDENVEGTLTFTQTGQKISGSFDVSAVFELFATSTEYTAEAEGRFNEIPFEPEAEATLQFSGAVDYTAETHGVYLEENDNFQVQVDEHRLQIFIGEPGSEEEGFGEVWFYIPASLGEGTYDVVVTQTTGINRPPDADVAARVSVQAPGMEDGARADAVSGTLTIESADPQNYAVTFDLTCSTSAGEVQASGTARYLKL
jgi:hypothetical protein